MAEAKEIAGKFVAAFNAHDERALLALHAAHIKFEAPGGVQYNTTADATAFAMRWLKGFPNGKMIIRNVPATHKKVSAKGVQILKVEHGQITEARVYYDQYEFMSQLGLIPAPATV
jgi:ketosteroid isomerase-like protein